MNPYCWLSWFLGDDPPARRLSRWHSRPATTYFTRYCDTEGPGFWTCLYLLEYVAVVAALSACRLATRTACAAYLPTGGRWTTGGPWTVVHLWFGRRPAGVSWRRLSALTVEPHLTGLATLGDGDGCADHCGYREPCANRGLLHDQVTVSVTRPEWPVW